jgi:hypothetical protein
VKWEDTGSKPNVEMLVPAYNKTDVLGLHSPRDKFVVWASNGKSVELWNNFKNIVYESIERFVPHKILRKIRTTTITTEIKPVFPNLCEIAAR